jgi:prepilin-type N-terminal cleavage/methylation domain-containing protein
MRHNSTPVNDARGFTLVEMLIVIAIMGAVGAMSAMIMPGFLRHQKAEGGVQQALEVIRTARETAISKRRNVRLVFTNPNVLRIVQENICSPIPCSDADAAAFVAGAGGTTTLRTIQLESRMEFLRPISTDTPDGFATTPAQTGAVAFGATPTRAFTSQGTLVDANGDVLNGTLFLGIPYQPNSARAITVFGTTALLRYWRWDGSKWVD